MAVAFQDYYELLGIGRDADAKGVKAAYRKMARKWHPDLHPSDQKEEAEEKFKRINEAYEVLRDPEKRERYDRLGQRWRDGDNFQAPPDMEGSHFYTTGDQGSDFNDGFSSFFETLFGQQRGQRTSRERQPRVRGQDMESEIELTIEEAYEGTTRPIRVSGASVCVACGGTGRREHGFCPDCAGTGSRRDEKTLEVKIPAGVQEGARIRLKGQGGVGLPGGPPGDLFLKVRFKPHPVFRVQGHDLESDLRVYPEQAVLGGQATAPTLDGSVTLTIPPGSHAGRKLRLRGKGLPDKRNQRGDQYVRIVVDIPARVTEEEREIYRQLQEYRQRGSDS